jgi:predicted NBD/HSP70 family sugar kinase
MFIEQTIGVAPKATKYDGRRRNLQLALQHVYREGLTTRAEISRLTGLTRATVSDLVAELVTGGLVKEVGPGTSSGGKPPTLLELDPTGRQIAAIDLSRRPFRGALVDLQGGIPHRITGRRGSRRGASALREVFALAEALVERSSAPLLGIGIGTPGIVDLDGSVAEAANLDWHGVQLAREIAERFDLPVEVANDAHAAALAEFGSRPVVNLALVKVGIGIGAGIVVNGELYRGDRPAAGEIGHIRVVEGGARCTCGNTGCLETVASVPNIIRRAVSLAGIDASAESLPWRASELEATVGGDALGEAIATAGRHLGAVLAHLVAILDVHRIAIAFELEGADQPFLEAVGSALAARILPSLASLVEVSVATHGPDLVLAGAAALVLREQLGVVWQ